MEMLGLMFALAVGQSWLLTLYARHFARRVQFLDWPDKTRKLHPAATPLLGGAAVCLTLLAGCYELLAMGGFALHRDGALHFVPALLLTTTLLCMIGLWDDRFVLSARVKFIGQILAILPFAVWGRTTTSVELLGWQVDSIWLGLPLTMLWLVSCTNFVNLIDGLDGLAGTVSLIVVATVGVLAYLNQLSDVLAICVVLCGAIIGFLGHNWPPARIFLGDSGSLPLGFLVGALAIEGSAKKAAGITLVAPLVLLSIPMFDTVMAILRRKLNGRNIGQGDREHIHHCLRDRGLTPQQTLLSIGGLCFATAASVLAAAVLGNDAIAVVGCSGVLVALISAQVFGFRETALLGRHVTAVWTQLAAVPRALRARFLLARFETSVEARWQEFWEQLVRRVERMEGESLEFASRDLQTNERLSYLTWSAEKSEARQRLTAGPVSASWELTCTVPRGVRHQTRLAVRGRVAVHSQAKHLSELLELFTAFCAGVPLNATLSSNGTPSIPMHPPRSSEVRGDAA